MRSQITDQRGFTLIELLTVVSLIGILAILAMSSLNSYRHKAAYTVSVRSLRDAQTSHEAALNVPDAIYAVTGLIVQNTPGPITNASAAQVLPAFQLPKNVEIQFSYDPTCNTAACVSSYIRIDHCLGTEHVEWTRFGDGLESLAENVIGSAC